MISYDNDLFREIMVVVSGEFLTEPLNDDFHKWKGEALIEFVSDNVKDMCQDWEFNPDGLIEVMYNMSASIYEWHLGKVESRSPC